MSAVARRKKNCEYVACPGPDLAGGRPGAQLQLNKSGLTKTMIKDARQLSRSLVGHQREIKYAPTP